jgi:hypothetical protein
VSKRGFQLETHFGTSDSAVKLSALAVRLEKPFRLFICRHWHCDSKSFIEERISLQIWQERRHSSVARGRYWAFSLELGASSIYLAACGLSWWKICIIKVVLPLAGRNLHQITPADHH